MSFQFTDDLLGADLGAILDPGITENRDYFHDCLSNHKGRLLCLLRGWVKMPHAHQSWSCGCLLGKRWKVQLQDGGAESLRMRTSKGLSYLRVNVFMYALQGIVLCAWDVREAALFPVGRWRCPGQTALTFDLLHDCLSPHLLLHSTFVPSLHLSYSHPWKTSGCQSASGWTVYPASG